MSDPDTCAHWRQLARHVSLGSHVPRLEITNRRSLRRDSDKLSEVLRLWRQHHPDTYTLTTLLHVLDIMVRQRHHAGVSFTIDTLQGMKSMYEWIQLMTKERLDIDRVEMYVTRCNTPQYGQYNRSYQSSPRHISRPLSVITDSDTELNSSFSPSHSSISPPASRSTVFATLYRPDHVPMRHHVSRDQAHVSPRPSSLPQHRHSSYIAPTITIDSGTPSPSTGRSGESGGQDRKCEK